MRHQILKPLLVAGVAFAVSSCNGILEPTNHAYDGPPVVEFAPVLPAGNYTMSVSVPSNSTADQTVSVGVNYVGPSPSHDVTGSFTLASGTTAVEGTHFTVSSKTYTISSGSNSTTIPVTIHGGALQNGGSATIVLELAAPGSGVGVSANYKQFTISISKGAG